MKKKKDDPKASKQEAPSLSEQVRQHIELGLMQSTQELANLLADPLVDGETVMLAAMAARLQDSADNLSSGLRTGEPQIVAAKLESFYNTINYVLDLLNKFTNPAMNPDFFAQAESLSTASAAPITAKDRGPLDLSEESLDEKFSRLAYQLENWAHTMRLIEPVLAKQGKQNSAAQDGSKNSRRHLH